MQVSLEAINSPVDPSDETPILANTVSVASRETMK